MKFQAVAVVVVIFSFISSSFSQEAKEKEIVQKICVAQEDRLADSNLNEENFSAEAPLSKDAMNQPSPQNLNILYKGFSIAPFSQGPSQKTPFLLSVEEAGAEQPKAQSVEIKPDRFDWELAIRQSFFFLGIQHSLRLTQEKTIENLKGPFFRDYGRSIKGIKGWGDGDGFVTNYIGHPLMGAISGFIQIQNDPKAARLQLSKSKDYWKSRAKALAWSAVYSTQFEIGMLSEATVGNVGKKPGTGGYVDFVVTPTLGTFAIVLEDAADKYLVNPIERRTENRHIIRLARMLLNPSRSFSNLLSLKKPWHRERGTVYSLVRNMTR
jgi:hypothetical protein